MLELHHLKESRSRRISWLLEELELDYQVIIYERDPKTRFAPPELKAIHPLGKAPVLKDGDQVLIESGAIIEYLIQRYGNGALVPAAGTAAYYQYLQWMHYAEGSAMLPILLRLYVGKLGEAGAPLHPRIHSDWRIISVIWSNRWKEKSGSAVTRSPARIFSYRSSHKLPCAPAVKTCIRIWRVLLRHWKRARRISALLRATVSKANS